MQIETILVADLHLDPSNARNHPTKNLDAIKGSLAKFGQQKTIVIDANNVVIAGNGTLEAAKALKWSTIQCVRSCLDGTDKMAFAIADNRTSELATWEDTVLRDSLTALDEAGVDLNSLGWDDEDLKQWLGEKEFVPDLPDDDEKDAKEKNLLLIVKCNTDDDLQMLFLELNDRGFQVKI